MSSMALIRVQKECKEVTTAGDITEAGINVEFDESNLLFVKGTINGPEGTPYEGGVFHLEMIVPQQYPFEPPKTKFVTRVWHPNISSQTGAICLDILKDKWAASLTLRTVLLSIQVMLCAPEPTDPQDAVVGKQYLEDRRMFNNTAKFWTSHFAGSKIEKDPDFTRKINRMVEMGVTESEAIAVLSCKNWHLERAVQYVFTDL